MKHPIAIYGSHDSNICIRLTGTDYRIYELERITGIRNYSLNLDPDRGKVIQFMFDFLKQQHGFEEYDSVFYCECLAETKLEIKNIFNPQHFERLEHHPGHAFGAMWQSPFDKSLIISFDGGGNDFDQTTYFNIYEGDKSNNSLNKIVTLPLNICHAYTMVSYPLSIIKKSDMDSYLSWAGKIMGLVAYGEIIQEWKESFKSFYYGHADNLELKLLFKKIGFSSEINSITDFKTQANIAATSQNVFEEMFLQGAMPYILKSDLPVCLTGGEALNVLLNQRLFNILAERNRSLFVPPNPNDCGLSLGFLCSRYAPEGKLEDMAFKGFPLFYFNNKGSICIENDNNKRSWLFEIHGEFKYWGTPSNIKDLAKFLSVGEIIGVVNEDSEVGPRALGNRSILCYPDKEEMKDKINSKIKLREMFRPFSPVVRREDVEMYFHPPYDSQYMTYSQQVKLEHTRFFKPIIHEDFSARVQTVTKEQNEFLYELLTELKELTGHGILLNTSFNSKGKPILTTCEEALTVLKETELDAVWINGYLFKK